MRRVLHQDIVALARCLLLLPKSARRRYSMRMVKFACIADDLRQESGRAHPVFGNGTLQSACGTAERACEPFPDDPEYADCLVTALMVVSEARANRHAHK